MTPASICQPNSDGWLVGAVPSARGVIRPVCSSVTIWGRTMNLTTFYWVHACILVFVSAEKELTRRLLFRLSVWLTNKDRVGELQSYGSGNEVGSSSLGNLGDDPLGAKRELLAVWEPR